MKLYLSFFLTHCHRGRWLLRRGPCRSPGTGRRRSRRWRSGWPAWPSGWLPERRGSASSPAGRPWRSPDTRMEWPSYLEAGSRLKQVNFGVFGYTYVWVDTGCLLGVTDLTAGLLRWWWGWTAAPGISPGRLRSPPPRQPPCRLPGRCRWTPGWTAGASLL